MSYSDRRRSESGWRGYDPPHVLVGVSRRDTHAIKASRHTYLVFSQASKSSSKGGEGGRLIEYV